MGYVIATSTTIDVAAADVSKFGDEYFGKPKTSKKGSKKDGDFFEGEEEKSELSEERKADQAAVDGKLMAAIGKWRTNRRSNRQFFRRLRRHCESCRGGRQWRPSLRNHLRL